jgi:hypothetical protein
MQDEGAIRIKPNILIQAIADPFATPLPDSHEAGSCQGSGVTFVLGPAGGQKGKFV